MTEDLFSGVLERGPVKAATSDGAWLAAMLATEASLAAAQADLGIIPGDAAAAIGAACGAPDRFDLAAIAARACEGGNPVIPLVDVLRELVGRQHATWVHVRTTSQDILDTAAMLVTRQSCELIRARTSTTRAVRLRRLVEAHARAPR